MGTSTRTGLGQVYLDAHTEALLRGDRGVSAGHVLLALLYDEGSAPARALGVDLTVARRVLEQLDEAALAALGIAPVSPGPVLPGRPGDRLPITPADPAHGTGSTVSRDGTVLGYRRLGSDPAVVLTHGSLMASHNPLKPGAALSDRFTVYLPDLRVSPSARS